MQVYAIDLLGFGDSEKALLDYSIDLWKEQVLAFTRSIIDRPVVLVGNSIGSLISLAAMREADCNTFRGAALLNCASAQLAQLVFDFA